jgi:excisionase family DNA binding protein
MDERTVSQETPRTNTNDYPPIMDTAMVAEFLGMNIQMVRKYAREGRIPAYKLPGGRTIRFMRDEIVAWLRSNPVVNPPESEVAGAHPASGGPRVSPLHLVEE